LSEVHPAPERFLETLETVLLNETTVGWVDTLMLGLGLTLTLAALAPALQAARQGRRRAK
jgi:hypothetical protein